MAESISFDEVSRLLNLSPEDAEVDRMVFGSTILFMEHYLRKRVRRVPDDLRECAVKLFLFKKGELARQMNGEDVRLELPESIKMVLDFHRRKTL